MNSTNSSSSTSPGVKIVVLSDDLDLRVYQRLTLNPMDLQVPPCVFTSLSSFVCICVFAHPSMKDSISRYWLAISVADFLNAFLTIPTMIQMTYCSSLPVLCGSSAQQSVLLYDFIVGYYIKGITALFSILCETYLIIERIFIILNRPYFKNLRVQVVCPIILLFCSVYFLPYFWALGIGPSGTVYIYKNESYVDYRYVRYNSPVALTLTNVISIARICLVLGLMTILNIITIVLFRMFMNKKSHLKASQAARNQVEPTSTSQVVLPSKSELSREQRASNNLTRMLICLCFLYIFGNVMFRVVFINSLVKFIYNQQTFTNLYNAGLFLLNIFSGLKIFVYLAYNKKFRRVFLAYFTTVTRIKVKSLDLETTAGTGRTHDARSNAKSNAKSGL